MLAMLFGSAWACRWLITCLLVSHTAAYLAGGSQGGTSTQRRAAFPNGERASKKKRETRQFEGTGLANQASAPRCTGCSITGQAAAMDEAYCLLPCLPNTTTPHVLVSAHWGSLLLSRKPSGVLHIAQYTHCTAPTRRLLVGAHNPL
jgi:hypothetical protein